MERIERFNEAFKKGLDAGLYANQRGLAKLMKCYEGNVSKARKGDPSALTDNFIDRFCRVVTAIRPEWIKTGEGEKYVPGTQINQQSNVSIGGNNNVNTNFDSAVLSLLDKKEMSLQESQAQINRLLDIIERMQGEKE